MKKLLVLSLSLLMGLSLAGCSNGGGEAGLSKDYKAVYQFDPETLDYVSTNKANTHEHTVNFVDGLLENDAYGKYVPSLAESYEHNEDFTKWTFHIRKGVKWVTATGEDYGKEVTAHDFVTGMMHAVDANSETLPLVRKDIKNLDEYISGKVEDFSEVGVKAVDDYTLEYTLNKPVPYFDTMTTYPILFPIQKDFLESKGCPLGEPKSKDCKFGTTSADSILYNGPFILTALDAKSKITYVKNASYWDAENVFVDNVTLIYDGGEDKYSVINAFENGTVDQAGLLASWSDYETYADKYKDNMTLTEPNAYSFGIQWNFNRVNYNITSKESQEEIDKAKAAVQNKNVRLAVLSAYDVKSNLMQTMTEEVAEQNLRNLNGVPNLVSTTDGKSYVTLMNEAYKEITGTEVDLSDGHMAFYSPENAKKYIEAAKADGIQFPVRFDLLLPSDRGEAYVNQGLSMKNSIEKNTDGNIIIDLQLQPYDTVNSVCFTMSNPKTAADYDFNIFSGWGPDYLDPYTFSHTFVATDGEYLPNIGLLKGSDADANKQIDDVANKIGLTEYTKLVNEANAITDDIDARYKAFAKADAFLLSEGLYIPSKMQTRGTVVTKVVPFTKTYALAGAGQYRLKYMKVQNEMVTKAQWEEAQKEWLSKVQ